MPVADELNEFMSAVNLAGAIRQKANSPAAGLSDPERYLLYEAIFLRLYRAYENLLEDVFLSYLTGEPTASGNQVNSFVTPTSRDHARALITSSQPFLDWTSPSTVVTRADTYIVGGDPIRTAIAASQSHLQHAKQIRNHIAHNSTTSEKDFRRVLVHFLLTAPAPIPSAGEFLAKIPTSGPAAGQEILSYFLNRLVSTARALVG